MFEAVIMLCLSNGMGSCRPTLLPGFEATEQEICEETLASRPPALPGSFDNMFISEPPNCQQAGPVIDFHRIADGVFLHEGAIAEAHQENRGDIANIAFIVGTKSVAIIDSGNTRWLGEGIYRAVRQQTDLPISHVILTHMHPDHVLGAGVLAEAGAEIVGHHRLARAISDRQESYLESLSRQIGAADAIGTYAPSVDIPVDETREIDLGNRILKLHSWPNAHTSNDLTVVDPQSGILFAGDLVFDRHLPTLDGSVLGWKEVIASMAQLPAQQVVPGHGGPLLPWPEGGAATVEYLDLLIRDTRDAIEKGEPLGEATGQIAQEAAEEWQLFDLFNARNATIAFTELEWE